MTFNSNRHSIGANLAQAMDEGEQEIKVKGSVHGYLGDAQVSRCVPWAAFRLKPAEQLDDISIIEFNNPKRYRLVKKDANDELMEVMFRQHGVVVSKELPPIAIPQRVFTQIVCKR